jgi:hypothetical protein
MQIVWKRESGKERKERKERKEKRRKEKERGSKTNWKIVSEK